MPNIAKPIKIIAKTISDIAIGIHALGCFSIGLIITVPNSLKSIAARTEPLPQFWHPDGRAVGRIFPGTELAFATAVRCSGRGLFAWKPRVVKHTTAIFRQINKDNPRTHHDALEFPDGQMVLLTDLWEGQEDSNPRLS
jgi:hypothetical protein